MSLCFTVPGEPHAWERAQQHGRRKFNSSKMTAAKQTIAQYAGLAIREQKAGLRYPASGRFWLDCTFFLGAKRATDPDIDNLVKLVADALNGVAWHDDRQIVGLKARKVRTTFLPTTEVLVIVEGDLEPENLWE